MSFWQEQELGPGGANEPADGFALVTAKIVNDHDVARAERRDEDLFDIDLEGLTIDRPLEEPWRINPIVPQRSQEGGCIPTAVGHFGFHSSAARPPCAQRRHIGLGPSLIDEDQALRVNSILVLDPLGAPACDVGTIALAGRHAFF